MRVPSVMPAAARRGLRSGEPKDSSGRAVRRLRGRSHSILRGAGIPKLKGLLPLHARRVGDDPILLLPPRLLATLELLRAQLLYCAAGVWELKRRGARADT